MRERESEERKLSGGSYKGANPIITAQPLKIPSQDNHLPKALPQLIKKAEHRRIDAFELWCWRRRLRVPWTARRSNQSILKEISPGCSLEGLMLKLKLQYIGHLMRRAD